MRELQEARMEEAQTGVVVAQAGDKLKALLRSRRFWACVAATAVSGLLYGLGEIDGNQFMDAITLIAAVYVGSIAIEDGLRSLITLWLQEPEIH